MYECPRTHLKFRMSCQLWYLVSRQSVSTRILDDVALPQKVFANRAFPIHLFGDAEDLLQHRAIGGWEEETISAILNIPSCVPIEIENRRRGPSSAFSGNLNVKITAGFCSVFMLLWFGARMS